MSIRSSLRRIVRPSRTHGAGPLWLRSALNALLFFAIFVAALPWAAHRLLPLRVPLPGIVETWVAGALALAGLAVWVACLDVFSRRGGGTPLATAAPRELVTGGPFSVVRNPLMASELAVVWAQFLHFGSLGIGLYAVALTAAAHWLVVRVEEPELEGRFGEAYTEYRRRVPRWMPRLARRAHLRTHEGSEER